MIDVQKKKYSNESNDSGKRHSGSLGTKNVKKGRQTISQTTTKGRKIVLGLCLVCQNNVIVKDTAGRNNGEIREGNSSLSKGNQEKKRKA